jgi:methyl-accepting chemotaxis protein
MQRYSLYTIVVFPIFVILIVVSFVSIYFTVTQHQKDLIETAIKEKTHLAETINETMASPIWIYRLAIVPGMERAFIEEMAKFKDVKYIRVVSSDGTIYKSSIEGEWGKVIKEPDISRVIRTRKEIIKDQIFQEERIKLIIYPGYQDKTIWVAFTLKGIEKVIRTMWIRDISIALGGLILIILILFTILRRIIDPLREMRVVCEEIAKGNLNIKMEVKSKTEIGELADTFNEMIKDLEKSHSALEESKKILEIKVAARTKELKDLVEQREMVIKERTKELQKKIEELERFHRFVVGRELKMIELKKEIKKLQERLKRQKK